MASKSKPIIEKLHSIYSILGQLADESLPSAPKNHYKPPNERFTIEDLKEKHERREPITVVTAYDYLSAVFLDDAGIDVCLVALSASKLFHGYSSNSAISMEEMLIHCRAVARGVKHSIIVGELPFGCYELSSKQVIDAAVKMLREGNVHGIKLNGTRFDIIKDIVRVGIPVMGSVTGECDSFDKMLEAAKALENAGCFAVVLEGVPVLEALMITATLEIPTIGMGAGPFCSEQMALFHHLLGIMPHQQPQPPLGQLINKEIQDYKKSVKDGRFPPLRSDSIPPSELDGLVDKFEGWMLGMQAESTTS